MSWTLAMVVAIAGAADAAPADDDADGYRAWLRYDPIVDPDLRSQYRRVVGAIVMPRTSVVLEAARDELLQAIPAMMGGPAPVLRRTGPEGAVVVVVSSDLGDVGIDPGGEPPRGEDAYRILYLEDADPPSVVVIGGGERGALYGVFRLLRWMQLRRPLDSLDIRDVPTIPLRMVDHWDNPRGDVERGYAGGSIFRWDDLPSLDPRYRDYARMLASVGINGCAVNNVNTWKDGTLEGWRLATAEYEPKVAALAVVFRRYGVRLWLSVDFALPIRTGDLETADPRDPRVRAWWTHRFARLYAAVPDLGGVLVKADSEGAAGPVEYGRTPADGADMFAAALAPHGGTVLWRAFVYGREDLDPDRTAQPFEVFQPLDGAFPSNACVQVKYGPLDFQVREPVSPLFGAMPRTRQVLEVQITQEYTGRDTHFVWLVPLWQEALGFDTRAAGEGTTVARILAGAAPGGCPPGGIAGVANIGDARNWTGHPLAQANTYGFGRIAWDPSVDAGELAAEWVRLTYGSDPDLVETLAGMLMRSRAVYESYTAPFGLGILCDGEHRGPDPYHRQPWHRADADGVGYDRTIATGSGAVGQYAEPVRDRYESVETCPEDLLLWFHHLPYDHRLDSGTRLIQAIYDRYQGGVDQARRMARDWDRLEGLIPPPVFTDVHDRFQAQVEEAAAWRDSVCGYFRELSGIDDHHRRNPRD